MQYNFKVKDAKEVDVKRILSETPESVDVILVTASGCYAIVGFREAFVENFDVSDNIMVAGAKLHERTGHLGFYASNSRGGLNLDITHQLNSSGWRFIQVSKDRIVDVLADLAKARSFLATNKREVRVNYL
jgi:hypothetical protein